MPSIAHIIKWKEAFLVCSKKASRNINFKLVLIYIIITHQGKILLHCQVSCVIKFNDNILFPKFLQALIGDSFHILTFLLNFNRHQRLYDADAPPPFCANCIRLQSALGVAHLLKRQCAVPTRLNKKRAPIYYTFKAMRIAWISGAHQSCSRRVSCRALSCTRAVCIAKTTYASYVCVGALKNSEEKEKYRTDQQNSL